MSFYLWTFCLFLTVSLTKQVVLPTAEALIAQDSAALAAANRTNLWTLCLVAAVIGAIALVFVPGALRRRSVQRLLAQPGEAFVLTGRFNTALRSELRQSDRLTDGRGCAGITFAFSATADGVRFWTGMVRPHSFFDIPWLAVDEFETSYYDNTGKVMSTISFSADLHHQMPSRMAFAVGSHRYLGFFPRGEAEVDRLVAELNRLRTDGLANLAAG